MGAKLLTISIGSLLLIMFIDFFTQWYRKFLMRWMPHVKIRILLGHLVWALLAAFFWNAFYRDLVPETFSITYLFFVLFIYSIRGLLDSFIKARSQDQ
ncbi:MAG: hypothetical protein ACE5IR_27125 [bacterium]